MFRDRRGAARDEGGRQRDIFARPAIMNLKGIPPRPRALSSVTGHFSRDARQGAQRSLSSSRLLVLADMISVEM
jgi:hypothetical protein